MNGQYSGLGLGEFIELGKIFGATLQNKDVVGLYGELGVGKTTFTKGIALALDISDEITSPTFNIVSIYPGRMTLVHIDAYRLDGKESIDILEHVREPYVIVAEWPNQLPDFQITKKVYIGIDPTGQRNVKLDDF